jgi:hypothetical protein
MLSRIPWTLLKRKFQSIIRRRFFRVESASAYQLLDADLEKVKQVLARNHFATWHVISYYYEHEEFGGEQLNMRRIESLDPEGRFWHTHVRGFEHPEGSVVCPHFELCPVEHPTAHLEKEGINVPIAMETTRDLWEANGIEVIEASRDA